MHTLHNIRIYILYSTDKHMCPIIATRVCLGVQNLIFRLRVVRYCLPRLGSGDKTFRVLIRAQPTVLAETVRLSTHVVALYV